jgi:hypothetical protein
VVLTACLAALELRAQERKRPASPPQTLEELARQVVTALKDEDYKRLSSLAISPEEFSKIGRASEKATAEYKKYHEALPKLAKRYRDYLDASGLFKPSVEIKFTSRPGEEESDRSTGVLAEAGDFKIELIDQAVRVDKKWYIVRLITARDERKLTK